MVYLLWIMLSVHVTCNQKCWHKTMWIEMRNSKHLLLEFSASKEDKGPSHFWLIPQRNFKGTIKASGTSSSLCVFVLKGFCLKTELHAFEYKPDSPCSDLISNLSNICKKLFSIVHGKTFEGYFRWKISLMVGLYSLSPNVITWGNIAALQCVGSDFSLYGCIHESFMSLLLNY